MAKPARSDAEAVAAPPPKKSRKLLVIILSVVLLLVLIGGAGLFFLLKSHPADEGEDGEVAAAPAKSAKKGKEVDPVYVAMEPFVVNLGSENGGPFMQLVLSLQVDEAPMGEKIKKATPKLRNDVIMLLSGKKADELITREGKTALAREIRLLMNEALDSGGKAEEGPVKAVLFTSFMIQ